MTEETGGREHAAALRALARLVFTHAFAEEAVLFPAARRALPEGDPLPPHRRGRTGLIGRPGRRGRTPALATGNRSHTTAPSTPTRSGHRPHRRPHLRRLAIPRPRRGHRRLARHYNRATDAARTAESPALLAHALAKQAVVLADIDRGHDAAQLCDQARALAAGTPRLLRSWLAAAHGEALAAADQSDASLRAFDTAHTLLPDPPSRLDYGPYLALDPAHLNRWRGHALARFDRPDATTVLRHALDEHDASSPEPKRAYAPISCSPTSPSASTTPPATNSMPPSAPPTSWAQPGNTAGSPAPPLPSPPDAGTTGGRAYRSELRPSAHAVSSRSSSRLAR